MVTTENLLPEIDTEAVKKHKKNYDETQAFLRERWEKAGFLDDIPEAHRGKAAIILENQRVFCDSQNQAEPNLSQHLLKLVKKMLKDFIVFDLVSVQPMLGPVSLAFTTQFGCRAKEGSELPEVALEFNEYEISAKTRKVMVCTPDDFESDASLDHLADELRDKITREIMTDLRNNVGTVMNRTVDLDALSYEDICINVVEMSGIIHRKTLRGGINWIVTGQDLGKRLAKATLIDLPEIVKPTFIGTMNGAWRLYIDPLFPAYEMLVGRTKDEELLDGYFYTPYIMLTQTPLIIDPESFETRFGLMSRYGKKLKCGAKLYGRIKYVHKEPVEDDDYHI